MGDITDSLTPPPPAPTTTTTTTTPSSSAAAAPTPLFQNQNSSSSRPMPVREDCWSEEATATLIDAWGRRYVELNRGNLRQKDWQDVADAVNALHGHTKKTHRTDVQCKNRIDTIKKKYKVEKARVSSSNGAFTSSWTFFDRFDVLIGSNQKKPSPPSLSPSPPVAVPLLPYRKASSTALVAIPQKRSAPPPVAADEGFFRRNYSAMAAAAAAAEAEEDEDDLENEEEVDEEEEEERESEDEGGVAVGDAEGMRRLARAIARFGAVYEKVEGEKLRQMVELEKQRMQFAKDLEVQRMRMFMDTQVQLERIKRGKRSASNVCALRICSKGLSTVGRLDLVRGLLLKQLNRK
ncbi:trihelix transcription factor ASIL2 isoform X1 [Morus notabilis]|uniref:trihelix transcription factor ASIL2 isoform X1 n=1 Tax=Morus notabilis TaxID=981085 RepID=UPI000CED0EF1|nr:trihelix transcription factor ASIL2 isoform X1 [Morus notabilis]